MAGTTGWLVCTAKRHNGERCKAAAIRGSNVCRVHGGMAGQVREAARKRLEELVMPSISTLRRIMLRGETDTVQLRAAEQILDRAGIVAKQEVAVDNQVSITVSYNDIITEAKAVVEGEVLAVSYDTVALPEGNGHEKTAPEGGHQNGAAGAD